MDACAPLGFVLGILLDLQTVANEGAPPGFAPAARSRQATLEERYLELPRADSMRRYLNILTQEPRRAGTPGAESSARFVAEQLKGMGFEVETPVFYGYLPEPKTVELHVLEPFEALLPTPEPGVAVDKDSFRRDVVVAHSAYAHSGEATGALVYVNYGLPADYAVLEERGIDVRGKVVIARYGNCYRGIKAEQAELRGAAGLIIYSDPADDGYMKGDVYPRGPWRPEGAVQRGSVLYTFRYPGDPLTPGIASVEGAKYLEPDQARSLPRIPVLPLSYGDARRLLEPLAGDVVPPGWQGGLPFAYHIGPGPTRVRLKLEFDYQMRPIRNVIARLSGAERADREVILGQHRDSWVYGAADNGSGTAVLLEVARALAALKQQGFAPRRSIVLCSWDGEEYGLIGSTEWCEAQAASLTERAIAYLNTDPAACGPNFSASAVPALQPLLRSVAARVPMPHGGKALASPAPSELRLGTLGGGSDYVPFLDYLGIPSLDVGFAGPYGVYHSIYDSLTWLELQGDRDFTAHVACARVLGLLLLRLAQADVVPLKHGETARVLLEQLGDLPRHEELADLKARAAALQAAATELDTVVQTLLAQEVPADRVAVLHEANDLIARLERRFLFEPGLPGRKWFKSLLSAPSLDSGYGVSYLPEIREASQRGDAEARSQGVQHLSSAIDAATKDLKTATQKITGAPAPPASGEANKGS